MVILPNMAKTVKRPLFHYFFAFFHILRCPYHGFSGHRVFLTHFWGCMRGGLWVLCAEVQKSQNASPVLKVLPPPRGGGGNLFPFYHTWTARNIFRAFRAISGELGADFGRFCAPEFARKRPKSPEMQISGEFGRFFRSENRLGRVLLIFAKNFHTVGVITLSITLITLLTPGTPI